MAFPFTHLCVAYKVSQDPQFLLGALAPDAVHYRKEFIGASMSGVNSIGGAKKITHLCPVSDEKWGSVTDNDGWIKNVKSFLQASPKDIFYTGYAAHVLTDIQNNQTLWANFRTAHPHEAAKGYKSLYYSDLKNIDYRLFHELPDSAEIMRILANANPQEMPGLVYKNEVYDIQQNILHEHFKNSAPDANYKYNFISFDDTLEFIGTAAAFVKTILGII